MEINRAILEVNNEAGPGFLEKVDKDDLLFELKQIGLKAEVKVGVRLCGSVAKRIEGIGWCRQSEKS
jgi:hypothetical protein